jgi:hypothetical protein
LLHRLIESVTRWLDVVYAVKKNGKVLGHIGHRVEPFFIPADNWEDGPDDAGQVEKQAWDHRRMDDAELD